MFEKLGGYMPSEQEMTAAIAQAFLRLCDEDKEDVLAIALKVRAPEIRAALITSASISGLAVPEEFEAEAAEILDRHNEDAGKRSSRGQKISEGHRRRREAEAELKSTPKVNTDATMSPAVRVSADYTEAAQTGRPTVAPPSATRPATPQVFDPRVDGGASSVAVPRAAQGVSTPASSSATPRLPMIPAAPSTHPTSGLRPTPTLSPATPTGQTPLAPRREEDHRG